MTTKQKEFSIGQIFRLGLLKNHLGQSYKDKASVSNVVKTLKTKKGKSPYGPATLVSEKEIERHNGKWS